MSGRLPTPEQHAAVTARDADVFLRAGAGTGKTTVLVDRFVAAIVEDDAELDSILAFTFTERAADQLRRRIRAALRRLSREAARAGDDERALDLERRARETESAWISTIHGFCRRLLAAHPTAAGIDPRFRVLEEGEAGRLARAAFSEALEQVLAEDDTEIASRLVAALRPVGLREIVRSAHDELRSRGMERPELPRLEPIPAEPAFAALGPAAEEAVAACEGQRPKEVQKMEALIDLIGDAGADGPDLDQLVALAPDRKAVPFKNGVGAGYLTAFGRARRSLAERELAGAYEIVRELLVRFCRRYEALKRSRSGLDFEDLQLRAVAALSESDAVRAAYADRFGHVLVDEFQDTNELQRTLIHLLQGEEAHLFCVGDELQAIYGFRHADVAVFRDEHRRFRERPDTEARVLSLTGNFRSRPELIAVVNAISSRIMPAEIERLTVGSAEPTEPAGKGPAVELLLTAAGKSVDWTVPEAGLELAEEEPAPAARIAEARMLASRIRSLCADAGSGVSAGDVVVLLRSFTWVDAYARALDSAGLRPHVIGGRGYWSQQQVDDVISVLTVISNPLDDEALLGALASPACAVIPDVLWLLRRIAGPGGRLWLALRDVNTQAQLSDEQRAWADAIPEEELERLRTFCERIESLRERAPLLGLEGLVETATEELGYDTATLLRERGAARWANVRKLMRLGREFEDHDGPDLAGFLAYAREEAERATEGEAPVAAERHDGVRIMTVHGAKGLEFPAVAVADLGRRLLGFPPSLRIGDGETDREPSEEAEEEESPSPLRVGLRLARLGRPSEVLGELEELAQIAETEESAEELRLAHVAATRAQRHLILSGTFSAGRKPDAEPTPGTPVSDRILSAMRDLGLGDLVAAGETGATVIELDPPDPRPGLEASFCPAAIAVRVAFPDEGARSMLTFPADQPRAEPTIPSGIKPPLLAPASAAGATSGEARLSYSALSLYEQCGYRFYAERVLGLSTLDDAGVIGGEEEQGSGREVRFGFGNAVHRLCEWSARNAWREPGVDRIRRALLAEGLNDTADDTERVRAQLLGWLGSPVCEELRAALEVRAELPFLLPVGGALIRGSIDLLARMPDGVVYVVDYKTNALGGRPPSDHMERYEAQRDLYALAARAHGERIRTAYVFLEDAASPVIRDYGEAELLAGEKRATALLAGIEAGHFEVTDRPHRGLCHDCPARERLCAHDAAATLRDDPAPPIAPVPSTGRDHADEPQSDPGDPQLTLLEGG